MFAWIGTHALDFVMLYFLGVIAFYTHSAWLQLKTLTYVVDRLLDRTPELPDPNEHPSAGDWRRFRASEIAPESGA